MRTLLAREVACARLVADLATAARTAVRRGPQLGAQARARLAGALEALYLLGTPKDRDPAVYELQAERLERRAAAVERLPNRALNGEL